MGNEKFKGNLFHNHCSDWGQTFRITITYQCK
ncbi:hypothetical protein T4D_15444, partial [Trichinella pseudospiralis]